MNPTNSHQQAKDLRASIHSLLRQLETYRITNSNDFENLEDWVQSSTDSTICDGMDVLMSISFYLI